jgi:hypothetical protein
MASQPLGGLAASVTVAGHRQTRTCGPAATECALALGMVTPTPVARGGEKGRWPQEGHPDRRGPSSGRGLGWYLLHLRTRTKTLNLNLKA